MAVTVVADTELERQREREGDRIATRCLALCVDLLTVVGKARFDASQETRSHVTLEATASTPPFVPALAEGRPGRGNSAMVCSTADARHGGRRVNRGARV